MTSDPLLEMAKYAVKSDTLIAYLIDIHLKKEGTDWELLAEKLELSPHQLAKLALCKRPRKDRYIQDITQIADYVDIEIQNLGRFITRLENAANLQSQSGDSFLAAARDFDEDE